MIEFFGGKVLKLVRVAIGPIRIGDLQIGKWRYLTPEERKGLGIGVGSRQQPRPSASRCPGGM
jgi:16S rRNA U516 pseudouridylate synthase RsuA-like enzyme